jgi:C1A family cysteine protease
MAKTSNKHVYGWKRDLPHNHPKLEHLHLANLPAKVDLRAQLPSCYDQGQIGSCTGNGLAGVVQNRLIVQKLSDWTPSRLFIYYMERDEEGTVNSDAGAEIHDGIKAVATFGVCPESQWPYVESKFTDKPTDQCYTEALKTKALSYLSLGQNLPTLKSKLVEGYPIVFGITVYESFESDEVARTGIVPMPTDNEECLGGHCIVIVGYDDSKNAFLIRNSWGTDWALDGHCWLPYAYVTNETLASDFWIIELIS